jgi:Uma2 family endonuclease
MTRTVSKIPAPLRLTGIPYDYYVRIRDAPGNRGLRMAYHDGVLEIMSPEYRHEKGGWRMGFLIAAYAEVFDVACEPTGSTTFRKGLPGQLKGKGKEPDESFYIGDDVALIRGRETLDLTVDPPPSLWVEVDNRASSKAKLPLYAALGIPEVWRYRPRSRRLWFGRLAGDHYEEIAESVALPGLTPTSVLELLAEGEARGTIPWNRWLRQVWFPGHRDEILARRAGH